MSNKPKIYATCPAGCLWETVHRDEFAKSASLVNVPVTAGSCAVDGFGKYRIHSAQGETGGYYAAKIYLMDGAWVTPMAPLATFTVEFDEFRSYFDFELLAATVDDDPTTSVTDLKVVYEVNGDRKTVYYSGSCAEPLLVITGADRVYRYNDGTIEGVDGVSPTVEVTEIAGGHQVSITDANGTHTFDVMDGNGGNGGGAVFVTVDAMNSIASHSALEIHDLVESGYVVTAGVLDDVLLSGIRFQYQGLSIVNNVTLATFTYTQVHEDGVTSTIFLRILTDKSVEIENFFSSVVEGGGTDGKSAYQIWLDAGNTGSEADFLESLKGKDGADGVDGKDYVLTEADKAEISALVIETLGGSPVFGYVDSDNNVILSGTLADGTYSVKYGNEDGSYSDIGTLEVGEISTDIDLFTAYTPILNKRWSNSSKAWSTQNGCVAFELPVADVVGKTMRFSGFSTTYGQATPTWYALGDDNLSYMQTAIFSDESLVDEGDNTYSWVIPSVDNATKWAVFLPINSDGATAITESDFTRVSWILTD